MLTGLTWRAALKEYWAFVMSNEGHAIELIGLHCENETDAKERVRQLVTDKPVELWDGPRRIARFDPTHLQCAPNASSPQEG